MPRREDETVCPACARGALVPEGTWATAPTRRGRRKPRRVHAVVRPPTHGQAPIDRGDTIHAELAPPQHVRRPTVEVDAGRALDVSE